MAYVPTRTDQTEHGQVDGKTDTFATAVEFTAAGFGIQRTVKGVATFEVLDALPGNRASTQEAVERGSAATVANTAAGAGFAAIDFATQDFVTAAEVGASDVDALDSDLLTSDLT